MGRSALWALVLAGCTTSSAMDAGDERPPAVDSGPLCGCTGGLHSSHIFVLSDDAALYSYDPLTRAFEFVLEPVCAAAERPFSMAIDPRGRAWILYVESRRILTIDVNDLAACEDSGYLPTVAEFPLFGMSFLQRGGCAQLYAMSYSGDGPFAEGPNLGALGVIEGDPPRLRVLSRTDYDGGELAGTGDGRLFAFAGVDPAKLVEYDANDGARGQILPLDGFSKTNASAAAFFGGDLYLFTEALPTECETCFEAECPTAWQACQLDNVCSSQIDCAIAMGGVQDDCGGGAGTEMVACLGQCSSSCLTSSAARVSQVTRIDWDESDGNGRARTVEVERAPIRIVGAASSPCVPTIPF